jgi:death-on-curing protein
MRYLTKEVVVRINHKMIERYGGHFVPPLNFLHEEKLDFLLESVSSSLFGEELYPTASKKAGFYMYSVISNHIFQDGNKRTGLECALLFLKLNGYKLQVEAKELIDFTLQVASGELSLVQVQVWIDKHLAVVD